MRTFALRSLLPAALLVTALPSPAEVSWGGNLGLSLTRNDQWSSLAHSGQNHYTFAGGLHLAASFFSPGTLDLGGSASYAGYRAAGGGASDGLNYQFSLGALARTPVRLGLSALRSTSDFTADSDRGRVGTSRVEALSGNLAIGVEALPTVSARVRNTVTTSRSAGTAPIRSEWTGLTAEVSQSVEALNYALSYDTAWSSGDYAETNYRTHSAVLRANAELSPRVTAQTSATYSLRSPTLLAPTNPRIDGQALSTWVQWSASNDTAGGGGYSYASTLFEAPGSDLRQVISHAVSASGWHRIDDQLSFDLGAGGTANQLRLGASDQKATSEQASAGLRWGRRVGPYDLSASFNGSLGLIQPTGAPNGTSWGVGTSADLSRPFGTWFGTASLGGSRDENSGASRGTRTRVFGSVNTTGQPYGWSFHGLLSTGYSLTESPLFGSQRSLNARLDVQANRSGIQFGLNAGATDDLSEALAPGNAGALVPVDFNTQSKYATASVTVPTVRHLFLGLVGRYVTFTSPGRATQWESGLSVNASYHLGAIAFTLYDQLTLGGSNLGSRGTQNLLFLSATRSFGR